MIDHFVWADQHDVVDCMGLVLRQVGEEYDLELDPDWEANARMIVSLEVPAESLGAYYARVSKVYPLPEPPRFVVRGMRHHQPEEYEADDLEEAVGVSYWGQANGDWAPERVELLGQVVLDHEALVRAWADYARVHGP